MENPSNETRKTAVMIIKMMTKGVIGLYLFGISCLFLSCKKEYTGEESALYGTWVKGSNFGDTLWFSQKNGRNVLKNGASFNAGMPLYSEKEYRLKGGQLSVQNFAPSSAAFYPIDSFTWTSVGSEFRILGYQLYPFMSSTATAFTFRKI